MPVRRPWYAVTAAAVALLVLGAFTGSTALPAASLVTGLGAALWADGGTPT